MIIDADHAGWANRQVETSLLTILYAIRYGMFRHSYAAGDAAQLAREHWDDFPPFIRDQIERDVRSGLDEGTIWEFDAHPWQWLLLRTAPKHVGERARAHGHDEMSP